MSVRRSGRGADALTAALRQLDGVQAKAGWFETARYPDGKPIAGVAYFHEYGTVKMPARPFMRPTVDDKRNEWTDTLAKGAAAVLRGEATALGVMEATALKAAGDIGETITRVTSPPLSPRTIARKGFAKPLVDTGAMLQQLTGVAERK